jgi:polyhydroxyalkanoate synthesis repressor PhaR
MSTAKKRDDQPTVIKKYANRRLYDTGRSSYVTLDDLCTMVKEDRDFEVYDAKTGEDLTRQVLTQIIVDQEGKGENLLPIPFLRQLIGFYGDSMQSLVPSYLEQTFAAFSRNQEKFREQFGKSFEGVMPGSMSKLEEMGRQNMAMIEKAMNAWTAGFGTMAKQGAAAATKAAENSEERIREMKKTIAEMEKEISRLSEKG